MTIDSIINIKDSIIVIDTVKTQFVENVVLPESINNFSHGNYLTEYVIPITTIIFAFLTVRISYKALKLNQKQNSLAVIPLLIFRPSTSHSRGKVSLRIFNKGIGPLTFLNFEMIYNGKTFKHCSDVFKELKQKFKYTDNDFDNDERLFSLKLDGYILETNERKTLMKYRLVKSEKESRKFYNELKTIKFNYTYADLYNNEKSGSFSLEDFY